jgi:hypothetical protein
LQKIEELKINIEAGKEKLKILNESIVNVA